MIEPEYRYIAGAKKLIVTPLYVDDELLAHIISRRSRETLVHHPTHA